MPGPSQNENTVAFGFYDPANALAPYLVQDQTVSYEGNNGMLQVPVGAPVVDGGPKIACKIVRAHAPVMQKVVTYLYQRLGALPLIPTPEPDDINQVLMEHRRIPVSPIPWGNGNNMVYSVMGEYVYALFMPLTTTQDAMPTGLGPAFANDGTIDVQIDSDDYTTPT
jgi:hypothetical protein